MVWMRLSRVIVVGKMNFTFQVTHSDIRTTQSARYRLTSCISISSPWVASTIFWNYSRYSLNCHKDEYLNWNQNFSPSLTGSVSNSSIFGTGRFYWSAWQRPYHINNRRFFMWTAQISAPILIRQFGAWYVKYAALHGASFGLLRFSISSKLSKRWRKNNIFRPTMAVFSKPLAKF